VSTIWYPIYNFGDAGQPTMKRRIHASISRPLLATGIAPLAGRGRSALSAYGAAQFSDDEWRRGQRPNGARTSAVRSNFARRAAFAEEPTDQSLTPDQAFDRAWRLKCRTRAERLRKEYESSGRRHSFAALAPRCEIRQRRLEDRFPDRAKMSTLAVNTALVDCDIALVSLRKRSHSRGGRYRCRATIAHRGLGGS